MDWCADVLENGGEDGNRNEGAAGSEGERDSVPFRRNRPTLVVDSDSALAIQVIKHAALGLKMSAGCILPLSLSSSWVTCCVECHA